MGIHPHFVSGMAASQIIPRGQAGGLLGLLQSLEGKHESFFSVVVVLWEQEPAAHRDIVMVFKSPTCS